MLFTFICGLVAHSYMFFNNSLSHDSLSEINGELYSNIWKIQAGRVFVPIYRLLTHTSIALPWLIGVFALFWIGLSVFLVTKLFNIKSDTLIFIVSAIFTTNITVTATVASYIHDFDCNMFAMLLSVLAVYLCNKFKYGFLFGSVCITLSLGLYQSYVAVTVTLLLFVLIYEAINNKNTKSTLITGSKGLVMLLISAILYITAVKVIPIVLGVTLSTGHNNSLSSLGKLNITTIIPEIIKAYTDCIYQFLTPAYSFPETLVRAISILIFLIIGVLVFATLFNKKVDVANKIVFIICIGLTPLAMNVTSVLSSGMSHLLTTYAFSLFYLLAIILSENFIKKHQNTEKNKSIKYNTPLLLTVMCILFIVINNIQVSNSVYFKKDLEHEATQSLFTKISYDLQKYDTYEPDKTPVVFVNEPSCLNSSIPGFEKYERIIGVNSTYGLFFTQKNRIQMYYDYYLITPIILAEDKYWYEMQNNEQIQKMPDYPSKGSIAMIDGVAVVKLSSIKSEVSPIYEY